MNKEAICHIPKSNYAYAYKENELHIRIRTAKNDMELVNIIFGCKYDWIHKEQKVMTKILSDQYYDYYQYNIQQEDSRIGYYFELRDKTETILLTEVGLIYEFDDTYAYCYFFQYPYINQVDIHREPAWAAEALFYQIFVERFDNGNQKNSPPYLTNWGEDPESFSFYGGDLEGIINHLDYLEDLGVNGIYLTPIFESPSNHKYDIVNYMEIDHFFGDKQTFKELVEKAHAKGMRIVLDAVFNHCSDAFPPFAEVCKMGAASEYYDWFFIDGDKVSKNPPNYKMFSFVPYMPKLNTSNPKVKEYLLSAVSYWTREFGIDGWRLDVSDEIDHKFWREFRSVVKEINEEAIIIGENWHNALPWLMGDQFDSVMNYPVTKLCLDYFATQTISTEMFENQLSTYLMRYTDQVNEAMLNLLDSHDTERFLYSTKENTKALKNAAAFLFAYKGIPCTYYGTEIGMTGNYDPGCRRGFNWNQEQWDMDLLQYYKKLMAIRKQENILKFGTVNFLSTDKVFVMKRTYDSKCMYIAINTTDQEQEIHITEPEFSLVKELLGEEVWKMSEGIITVKVPANTSYYMKFA
ncbi:MAG: glycoside hydrolase family 13 protein [Mobilitalea sp.]